MEVSQPRSNERVGLADTKGLTVDRACNALKLNEILVLGSARLTSAVRDAGLQGIAVDFDKSRSQGPHIAVYDLNDPAQFSSLVGFINLERSRIIWAHFAPSCGTDSRARGRPLKSWEQEGFKFRNLYAQILILWACRNFLEQTNFGQRLLTSLTGRLLSWYSCYIILGLQFQSTIR